VIWRSLLIWTLGTAAFAYTPTAPEILSRMAAAVRRADPVEARVVREGPDGKVIEKALIVVPGHSDTTRSLQAVLDLPYNMMILPVEELSHALPSVMSEDASVSLGRLGGRVCYILEGKEARLWVSKGDLLPLKVEVLTRKRLGTAYLYLEMVNLSENVSYPSRTEVWRDGELVLVERLLPATAATEGP